MVIPLTSLFDIYWQAVTQPITAWVAAELPDLQQISKGGGGDDGDFHDNEDETGKVSKKASNRKVKTVH